MIWEYKAGTNLREFNEAQLKNHIATMSYEEGKTWFLYKTYGAGEFQCQILDEGIFFNHSDTPNCITKTDHHTYAKRDIEAGEQLQDDYSTFDFPDFIYPIRDHFNV